MMNPPPTDDEIGEASGRGDWPEYRRLVLSKLEQLHKDQREVNQKLNNIEAHFKSEYITKEYFHAVLDPIRNIVYGMVGLLLVAFLSALISLVITQGVIQ